MVWTSALAAALLMVACSPVVAHPVDQSDPRFVECGGDLQAHAAFPLDAAEYQLHFPHMGRSPELENGGPAFAVVFGPEYIPAIFGGTQATVAAPGTRYVCIYDGMPPEGERNIYGDVDITGMTP